MKTKIIPFDLETAKKIQAGEIEGKIITKLGWDVTRIIFDIKHQLYPLLVCFWNPETNQEEAWRYKNDGEIECRANEYGSRHLFLEVPDNEPQFKPFDKVLVRNDINSIWQPSIFSYQLGDCCYTVSSYPYEKENIIPYEGNEHLLGTTDDILNLKTPRFSIIDAKLQDQDFSIRVLNILRCAELVTVRDLVRYKRADLLKFRNFGKISLRDIDQWLEKHELHFGMDV